MDLYRKKAASLRGNHVSQDRSNTGSGKVMNLFQRRKYKAAVEADSKENMVMQAPVK